MAYAMKIILTIKKSINCPYITCLNKKSEEACQEKHISSTSSYMIQEFTLPYKLPLKNNVIFWICIYAFIR